MHRSRSFPSWQQPFVFVAISLVRAAHTRPYRGIGVAVDKKTAPDMLLLALGGISMLAPLAYVFSHLLDFADYHLPNWTGWLGAILFAVAIWLLRDNVS
jgi:hypothetical protein